MNSYSIDQARRGGNVTAAATRRTIADCYKRIAEGRGTPQDVKTAVGDAKRNWKRMRAELASLGIDADTITAEALQAEMNAIVDLAYGQHPMSEARTAARKRYNQLEQLQGALWYRDFIVKHNS